MIGVRSDDWLYRTGWLLVRGFARLVWRLEVHGASNVPLEGAAIIAPNHLSLLDPPLIGCACPRELRFIAKAELFRYGCSLSSSEGWARSLWSAARRMWARLRPRCGS
jgi:hypothetical protein